MQTVMLERMRANLSSASDHLIQNVPGISHQTERDLHPRGEVFGVVEADSFNADMWALRHQFPQQLPCVPLAKVDDLQPRHPVLCKLQAEGHIVNDDNTLGSSMPGTHGCQDAHCHAHKLWSIFLVSWVQGSGQILLAVKQVCIASFQQLMHD